MGLAEHHETVPALRSGLLLYRRRRCQHRNGRRLRHRHRATSKVNIGALKKGYVNIAVHGHLPTLVSEIVRVGRSQEFIDLAKAHGAKGIQFYGVCCSCLAAMYRYEGVIPLSNAVGAELVLGTGALDLWVADVQDVFPSIMDVARCFKTTVVTTSDSAVCPAPNTTPMTTTIPTLKIRKNWLEKS